MRSVLATTALVLLVGGLGIVSAAVPAGAGTGPHGPLGDREDGQAAPSADGRVLLMSVPGLTWQDVQDNDLEFIDEFLETAAVAAHAPRGVSATSRPGAAYLTISAGSRAAGEPEVDGQQLSPEDRSAGSSAGEVFQRRTGTEVAGDYVALSWSDLVSRNSAQQYDAELGLLTETLTEAGFGTGVVANADGTDTVGTSFERQAGLATATPDGEIPSGALSADLLEQVGDAPYGLRLDEDRVVDRFQEQWDAPGGEDGGLVLVEASDMARSLRHQDQVDVEADEQWWQEAVLGADELFGRLLDEVDPERDSVLLLAPYNFRGDRDLTVAALRPAADDQGSAAGYLGSASTQRDGFVTLVDVAPTVLNLLGVDRPPSMEGRPFTIRSSSTSVEDRVDRMVSANAASRFREHLLVPTTLAIVVSLAVVALATVAFVAWGRRAGPGTVVIRGAALFTLAIMPMSFLARAFPLEERGLGFYWPFVLTTAALTAVLALVVARAVGRPRLALILVLLLIVGVPAFDVMTGSHLGLSSAFGYSPTGNSRLYGISNYALGAYAAAASVLASLVASVPPARRNGMVAVGIMVAALAVLGVPIWGANVGGILSFTPVVVLFAMIVLGDRVRLRPLVIGFVAITTVAVTLFAALDLARPAEERAHLGRLIERVREDGIGPLLSIIERKGVAAIEVTFTSFWTLGLLTGVALWLALRWLPARPLESLRARIPKLHAALAAAAVMTVLGTVLNDSGGIVGGSTMLVVAVTLVCLTFEPSLTAPAVAPAVAAAAVGEVEEERSDVGGLTAADTDGDGFGGDGDGRGTAGAPSGETGDREDSEEVASGGAG